MQIDSLRHLTREIFSVVSSKVSYFFFPRKSSPVIHSFKSQNAVIKNKLFFSFTGKVHRSFIRILMKFPFFLIKVVCVFFPRFLCVFLFFFSANPEKIKNTVFFFPWKSLQGTNSRKKKIPHKNRTYYYTFFELDLRGTRE